jgi:YVTN family beta-propeller protein
MSRFVIVLSGLLLAVCACQLSSDEPRIQLTPDSISHISLDGPVSSSAVAVSPDGRLVAAVNPDSDSITLVDVSTLAVLAEIPVGENPRTLSFTPNSKTVVVANYGSATISKVNLNQTVDVTQYSVGSMPYGVVTDGVHAFVAEFALGTVSIIDLMTGDLLTRIPVDAFPTGLALSRDGQRLLVTHFFTGRLTVINQQAAAVVGTISAGSDTNLSQFVMISVDGSLAYVPQTRFNVGNTARLFDTTVFPVVNLLDINNLKLLPSNRITLDTADQPVNMPFSVALAPDEQTLYVANAGSDDVSVIDLNTNRGLAHISVGSNPRGIAVSPDGSHVYVNNVLDGNLSVIDTDTLTVTNLVTVTNIPLSPTLLEGKKIFNSAASPSLTTDHWISCATCHFDGMMDGRTWMGFPDGPRNTPALFGVRQTLPMHWSGDLDELQDVEVTIRDIQFGTGLITGSPNDTLGKPHAGLSHELDALAAYLGTIEVLDSPFRGNRAEINIGRSLFENLGCQSCHTPPLYTDHKLHDVGSGDPSLERNSHGRGTSFDTPSLIGLWLTAPYFHDGSAATLEQVLQTETVHNVLDNIQAEELTALIAFMRGLPDGNSDAH